MKTQNTEYRNQTEYSCVFLRPLLSALGFCLMVLSLSGCGYTIHTKASLPFEDIQIGTIENKTYEPKLQDRLNKSLTEEFLKQGIAVRR